MKKKLIKDICVKDTRKRLDLIGFFFKQGKKLNKIPILQHYNFTLSSLYLFINYFTPHLPTDLKYFKR